MKVLCICCHNSILYCSDWLWEKFWLRAPATSPRNDFRVCLFVCPGFFLLISLWFFYSCYFTSILGFGDLRAMLGLFFDNFNFKKHEKVQRKRPKSKISVTFLSNYLAIDWASSQQNLMQKAFFASLKLKLLEKNGV